MRIRCYHCGNILPKDEMVMIDESYYEERRAGIDLNLTLNYLYICEKCYSDDWGYHRGRH